MPYAVSTLLTKSVVYCYVINMKTIKKYCLITLPYIVCIIASLAFFFFGNAFDSNIKSLMHGIAGSFLSIPILYLIYELSKDFSRRKLNKKLFDYAKMQIDRDVLSIINQLMKFVLTYDDVSLSPENVQHFLSQTKNEIANTLKKSEYLGFQVFKNWSITERNITTILENPFILKQLDNDQIVSIVDLLREIRAFEFMPKNVKDLYISTGKNVKGYKIESGRNLNERNNEYLDRHLLLKGLGNSKFLVVDFGDFAAYQTEKLLHIYKINEKYIEHIANTLFEFLSSIELWIELTGNEFLIDTKMFRSVLKRNV